MDPTHDADRLEHLHKLRTIYQHNLDNLEVMLARAGMQPPTALLTEIAETKRSLGIVKEAISGAGAASALNGIGTEGQAQRIEKALLTILESQRGHDAHDDERRIARQSETDRRERLIIALLIAVLFFLLLHLLMRW